MDIPPLAWLGIGAFVAIASFVIGDALQVFFWVGLLFIAIGTTKQIISYVVGDEGPGEESFLSLLRKGTEAEVPTPEQLLAKHRQHHPLPAPEGRHAKHAAPKTHRPPAGVVHTGIGPTCPYCMGLVRHSDNFCPSCGTRLR